MTHLLDVLLRALTWPRRKLAVIGYEHEYRKAQLRALVAELDSVGSMSYADDPAARKAGYLGTWNPHAEPWETAGAHFTEDPPAPELLDDLPEPDDEWAARIRRELHDAPLPEPTRRATADEWAQWYDQPDYKKRLAAEQAAFSRWLDRQTARWHKVNTTGARP